MSEFLHRLAESVERLGVGGGGCVVAVSGGADSVGLLVGLVRVLGAERLHVAHLEHGLRGAAGREDAAWVQGLCERLGVKATVGAADVGAAAAESGESVETQGREVRYGFLLRVAQDQGCEAVAVGHTADDQAETIVHRIVRGTGLRGLAGMPAVRRLGEGVRLVRPMLGVRRAQVEAFLRAEGVAWREDASNEWLSYTRNRIRHEVMPVLRGLNGQVEEALVRLGRTARWWSERVEGEAEATLESLTFEKGAGRLVLDARRLRELAEGEQAEVVRAALRRLGVGERRLGQRHVMAMLAVCEREGPVATEGPEGVRVRRSGGRLYFTRPGRS